MSVRTQTHTGLRRAKRGDRCARAELRLERRGSRAIVIEGRQIGGGQETPCTNLVSIPARFNDASKLALSTLFT
jgi:hypothetical protein